MIFRSRMVLKKDQVASFRVPLPCKLAAKPIGGHRDFHLFWPWEAQGRHDCNELIHAPASPQPRNGRALLPHTRDLPLSLIARWVNTRIVATNRKLITHP